MSAPQLQRTQEGTRTLGRKWLERRFEVVRFLIVLAGLFGLAFSLASSAGVFRSELTMEADEPAHYITALMVRDYIVQGFPAPPMQFAKNYYLHYPKVAFGHWPPMFYVSQVAWMLLFGVSRTSVLLFIIAETTALAATLYAVVRKVFGLTFLAIGVAAIFTCIPIVQMYAGALMADMQVALFSTWAVLAWVRSIENCSWRNCILFAVLASAAILTKGNGFALAIFAPLTVFLCRRWDLVKRPPVWGATALIGALCVPWNLLTRQFIVPTMQGDFGAAFIREALQFYTVNLLRAPGLVVSILASVGFLAFAVAAIRRSQVRPLYAAAFAQVVAVIIFHALLPAGLEVRYLLAAFPFWLFFAADTVNEIAKRLDPYIMRRRAWTAVLATVILIVFLATAFRVPRKYRLGFDEVADVLTGQQRFRNAVILCSSREGAHGEGVLISEIAMREARPGHVILRGSRVLSDSDWNGRQYHLTFRSPADVDRMLATLPVDVVVLEMIPAPELEHTRLLRAAITADPRWHLAGIYPQHAIDWTKPGSRIELWEQEGASGEFHRPLHVEMSPTPKIVW